MVTQQTPIHVYGAYDKLDKNEINNDKLHKKPLSAYVNRKRQHEKNPKQNKRKSGRSRKKEHQQKNRNYLSLELTLKCIKFV